MFPPIVFFAIFFAACGYALWRGGAPERAVAACFLVAGLATPLLDLPQVQRFYSVAIGVFAIDLLLLAALLAIALRADRFWPMLVASLQAIIIIAHLVKFANPELIRRAYAMMIALWTYPQLLLLVAGTVRHRRRLRRNGTDSSWKGSSAHSTKKRQSAGPMP
ncbi:MAG: hypothetical protein QOG13_3026 [Sphingomonadales bacterium]|nr:hypothetical protein [Sphingomonadales bacterium]MEA3045105.1 hypothetical protein [Sphingomonadales bacterium]